MRRRGTWGCGAALLLALGPWVAVATADPADGGSQPPAGQGSSGWYFPMWEALKKPMSKPAKPADKKDPARSAAEEPAAVRARERAALLRRQAACNRLREIGLRLNDESLMSQADALDQQAWQVYQMKTASLPAPGPADQGAGAGKTNGGTPGHGTMREDKQ